ncbi:MAG: phosphatidylglycerophosphatase A [Epsilonproteobacteria bacterium]|nr:phosphatidylglycerophosphatase A [Campylobacterota bacterium]
MNWFFLTFGYTGLAPKAPGTVGSFFAIFPALPIILYMDNYTLFLAAIVITLMGIDAVNKYEQNGGIHDNKHIVIDEVAGMWIALSIAPSYAVENIYDLSNGFIIQTVLSFLLFRYFDITKPSIIGRIDRNAKGGIGVMLDDVIAGFAAGISAAVLWQGWLSLSQYLN